MQSKHLKLTRGFRVGVGNRRGRRLMRTLNIYVPPAFKKSGARLPRGR